MNILLHQFRQNSRAVTARTTPDRRKGHQTTTAVSRCRTIGNGVKNVDTVKEMALSFVFENICKGGEICSFTLLVVILVARTVHLQTTSASKPCCCPCTASTCVLSRQPQSATVPDAAFFRSHQTRSDQIDSTVVDRLRCSCDERLGALAGCIAKAVTKRSRPLKERSFLALQPVRSRSRSSATIEQPCCQLPWPSNTTLIILARSPLTPGRLSFQRIQDHTPQIY